MHIWLNEDLSQQKRNSGFSSLSLCNPLPLSQKWSLYELIMRLCACRRALLDPSHLPGFGPPKSSRKQTYQSDTQYLWERVRRAAGWSETNSCIRCLKPGLFTRPDDVAERQNGSPQAESRSIDRNHDWLLKLDKSFDKIPAVLEKEENCY